MSHNYAEIWKFLSKIYFKQKEKCCWSCGKPLSIEPRSYYFDHLIEKSIRPDLATQEDNIFVCCLSCHALKTAGFPTEKHKAAIDRAKEIFGIS